MHSRGKTSWDTHWPLYVDVHVARYLRKLHGVFAYVFGRSVLEIAWLLHGTRLSLQGYRRVVEDLKVLEDCDMVRKARFGRWRASDLGRIISFGTKLDRRTCSR